MSCIPFFKAFSILPAGDFPALERANVEKMKIISSRREIEAEVRFEEFIPFDEFEGIKAAIIKAYSLSSALLTPVFAGARLGPQIGGYISDFVGREHRPALSVIEEAGMSFEEDRVVFELPVASLDFVLGTGIVRDLTRFLSELCGRPVSAEFVGSDQKARFETEDFERVMAERELEAIEQAEKEAAEAEAQESLDAVTENIEVCLERAGVPERFIKATFGELMDVSPALMTAITEIEGGRSIYLYGHPGTGKSHIVAAAVRSALLSGTLKPETVAFVVVP